MGVARAIVLIAIQSVFVFIIGFGIVLPKLIPDVESPFLPTASLFAFVVVTAVVSFVALIWLGSVRTGWGSFAALGWTTTELRSDLVRGLLGGIVASGVVILVTLALGTSWASIVASIVDMSWQQRLVFLVIGVQAGVIEESLFRGNLMRVMEPKLGYGGAVGLQAVVFALYHLKPNPVALVTRTLLGLVFGITRGRTGSLVAPAIAHAMLWTTVGAM